MIYFVSSGCKTLQISVDPGAQFTQYLTFFPADLLPWSRGSPPGDNVMFADACSVPNMLCDMFVTEQCND